MSEAQPRIWRPPTVDGIHYPPMEATTLLTRMPNGTIKAADKMPVPLNEFGIPDADGIIDTALGTISRDHTFPIRSNRHHLATPARFYLEHSSGLKIPESYREAGAMIIRIQVQLHNYLHEIFEVPPDPTMEVMSQVSIEQAHVDTLAYLGKRAVGLSRASFVGIKDLADRSERRLDAKRQAREFKQRFYAYLEKCPKGEVGILPDPNLLGSLRFHQAVNELGDRSGANGRDYREEVQRRLGQLGFAAA